MFGRKISSLRNRVKRNKTKKSVKNISAGYVVSGILFVTLMVIIALVSPVVKAMVGFETSTKFDNSEVKKWDYSEKFKVLLVGIDKKTEEYIFVDAIALLVVDPKHDQVGMINIHPDVSVTDSSDASQVTLRRGLIDNDKGDIVYLAEELLATKIDRYVIVDKVYLDKMAKFTKTIHIENMQDVEDPDVFSKDNTSRWVKGTHSVRSDDINDYVRSDKNGKDEQLQRQLELYKRYVQNIDLVKLILGTEEVLEILEDTVSTNLSRNEIYYLYYYLRSVPPTSYSYAITKSDILSQVGRAGVYDIYKVNEAQLDYNTNAILEDKDSVLEQTTVEILNASGQSGKARRFSRWVGNVGLEVIHVGNAPFSSDNTEIYAPYMNEYPSSMDHLKVIFGDNAKVIDNEYEYRHIGKVVVVIGEN